MTTIAYNHKDKQIAYDSRVTAGDTIGSDSFDKRKVVDGVTFIISGALADYDYLIAAYFGGDASINSGISAFVIDGGVVYKCAIDDDDGFWKMEMPHSEALGSGFKHALTAMDMGAPAKEAVEIACKRDVYSGGKVRIINID